MTGSTHARGRAAEEAAVRWLETQGYVILERNVVNRGGEIDVIARGPAKRRRLSRAAALHLATRGLHLTACRFDVLGLDWVDGAWRYTLVRDAFPYTP